MTRQTGITLSEEAMARFYRYKSENQKATLSSLVNQFLLELPLRDANAKSQ